MAELRSFIFLNRLQPQTMCYLGTWIRGSLPRSDVAAQIIEVAPGLDIEPLTDVALKHAGVRAGILVVERQFGYLEIHGGNDEVRAAGSEVLDVLGVSARDATRPEVLASKIISMLEDAGSGPGKATPGLGLSLVARLVEEGLGGTVTSGQLGGRYRVEVRFPVEEREGVRAGADR